jgi:hypothetical protein
MLDPIMSRRPKPAQVVQRIDALRTVSLAPPLPTKTLLRQGPDDAALTAEVKAYDLRPPPDTKVFPERTPRAPDRSYTERVDPSALKPAAAPTPSPQPAHRKPARERVAEKAKTEPASPPPPKPQPETEAAKPKPKPKAKTNPDPWKRPVPPPPPPVGPSWITAILMTGTATCLAFIAGIVVGASRNPDPVAIALAPAELPAQSVLQPTPEPAAPPPAPAPVAERAADLPAKPEVKPEPKPAAPPPSGLGDADSAFRYGLSELNAGRAHSAISALTRAVELNPAHANAHRSLGDAHKKASDVARAVRHYKIYLALRPQADDAPAVRAFVKQAGE